MSNYIELWHSGHSFTLIRHIDGKEFVDVIRLDGWSPEASQYVDQCNTHQIDPYDTLIQDDDPQWDIINEIFCGLYEEAEEDDELDIDDGHVDRLSKTFGFEDGGCASDKQVEYLINCNDNLEDALERANERLINQFTQLSMVIRDHRETIEGYELELNIERDAVENLEKTIKTLKEEIDEQRATIELLELKADRLNRIPSVVQRLFGAI
jgi:hypothetical protein